MLDLPPRKWNASWPCSRLQLTNPFDVKRSEHDQELDSLMVGPIPVGVNKFIFEADPPTLGRIPPSEILGVTVLLLTCSYDGREFVRVGYYTNNEYDSEELNLEPPSKPVVDRIVRNVLAEKPRVTRFAIKWYEALLTPTLEHLPLEGVTKFNNQKFCRDTEDSEPPLYPPDQPEADEAPDDEDQYAADEVVIEEEGVERRVEVDVDAMDEDTEMVGADDAIGAKDDDEISNDGSEDLEAESSGSEDEEDEDDDEPMDVSAENQLEHENTIGGPSGHALPK